MINLILTALVPVAFVVILGFVAGKTKLVNSDGAKSLSTTVVNFALPCTLFVSIFGFSPSQFENVDYVLTLFIGIIIPFLFALFLGLFVWKKPAGEASLFASNGGFPDMAYFGLPVVMTVVGQQGMLPIIVGNIITSIVVIPVVMALLNKQKGAAQGTTPGAATTPGIGTILLNTIKQPVVWAPILGLILALLGFKLPTLATDSLKLIGGISGGLALFTLGILLSFLTPRIDLQVIAVVILKKILRCRHWSCCWHSCLSSIRCWPKVPSSLPPARAPPWVRCLVLSLLLLPTKYRDKFSPATWWRFFPWRCGFLSLKRCSNHNSSHFIKRNPS